MTKHSNLIILSIVLGFIIFILLGLPFTQWWLTGDDFHGIFLGYKTKTWSNLLNFFTDGHTNQGVGIPGGYVLDKPSFLGAYYRPLYCIYLTLQFWLFGTHGYGYFLCNVGVHAITSSLLFYLVGQYASRWTALLCGLLFAVHPQIAYRFGAVVNFHYYINVMLVLCIALCMRRYIVSNNLWWLSSSLFLFAASLFTRESTIVLPAIITILLIAQAHAIKQIIPWKKNFTAGLSFALVSLSFLCLRLYLYPLQKIAANGTFLPQIGTSNFITLKFQEFLVFLYDFLYLSWLPWGNRQLKLAIIIPLIFLLSITFIRCHQKLLTITFFVCGFIMLWPGMIGVYSPRYIYESMPYFVSGYATLFVCSNFSIEFKTILKFIVSIATVVLFIFTIQSFGIREKKLATMHRATIKLISNPELLQRPLCFLAMPNDGGWNGPIMWILLNNRNHKVFFESSLVFTQHDSNIVTPGRWYNSIAPYYDENFFEIRLIGKSLKCISLNTSKIIFESCNNDRPHKIGALHILERTDRGKISKIQINIAEQIWQLKPLFISWNYKTKQFDVVDKFRINAT